VVYPVGCDAVEPNSIAKTHIMEDIIKTLLAGGKIETVRPFNWMLLLENGFESTGLPY
jgi:hypothetical protein